MNVQTERLLIRPFAATDLSALTPILGDEQVMRYSLTGPLTPQQVAQRITYLIDHLAKHGFSKYAVQRKSDDALIGYCGVEMFDFPGWVGPEVGFRLARSFWGKGYATEAGRAVVADFIARFPGRSLWGVVDIENTRSLSAMEKLGLTHHSDIDLRGMRHRLYSLNGSHESGR